MKQVTSSTVLAAALLLVSLANALPHDEHESMDMSTDMKMDGGMGMNQTLAAEAPNDSTAVMSYFSYGKHTGSILTHIILMVLAWCFVLPVGKIPRSH